MLNDPEKHSNPRIFKVSDRLLNILALLGCENEEAAYSAMET